MTAHAIFILLFCLIIIVMVLLGMRAEHKNK